jgi:hypothetical protein
VTGIAADLRSLDPAVYAAAIGLAPDDCYGFLPIDHDEITPYLFLYRDREQYAQARAGLAAPQHVKNYFGLVRVEPTQQIEIDASSDPKAAQGDFSDVIAAVQQMADAYGDAGFGSSTGAPPTPARPDPERLARLEKLRASNAITEAEYLKLAGEALGPTEQTAPPPPPGRSSEGGSGPPIIAHRIYPGRWRSSGRQLDYFLPRYRDALGLRSDDTYGVLPRGTTETLETGSNEWDDYWVVYRDRPEYAAGREEWARKMNKKGNWPEPMVYPGVGEAPSLTHDPGGAGGKLRIEKQGWPRKALVKRETGDELGASMRDRLERWGYGPEDSFGLSPNYTNRSIYFAWRK